MAGGRHRQDQEGPDVARRADPERQQRQRGGDHRPVGPVTRGERAPAGDEQDREGDRRGPEHQAEERVGAEHEPLRDLHRVGARRRGDHESVDVEPERCRRDGQPRQRQHHRERLTAAPVVRCPRAQPAQGRGRRADRQHHAPQRHAAVCVGPDQKIWRNQPQLPVPDQQPHQEGEQEQRQELRPHRPGAGGDRQPDRQQHEPGQARPDHQLVDGDRGGQDQGCRAELQARHSAARPVGGVHQELREPFVIRPGRPVRRVGIEIDARNVAAPPDVRARPQVPEGVRLRRREQRQHRDGDEQQTDRHLVERQPARPPSAAPGGARRR